MTNNNYLELHLPEYLQTALNQFIEGKKKYEKGGYFRFDCDMVLQRGVYSLHILLMANIILHQVDLLVILTTL